MGKLQQFDLEDIIYDAFLEQPELVLSWYDDKLIFSGPFTIRTGSRNIATFPLEITQTQPYPEKEPVVRLIDRVFPFTTERHIYADGTCCTSIWEYWLATSSDLSFRSFLKGPVREFFLSQLYFEEKGVWPFGEWSHNLRGLLEAYSSLLEVPPRYEHVSGRLTKIVRRNRGFRNVTPFLAKTMLEKLKSAVGNTTKSPGESLVDRQMPFGIREKLISTTALKLIFTAREIR